MRVEVPGASGGETPGNGRTSFRFGHRPALDAGGLPRSVPVAVEEGLLPPARLDPVRDLAGGDKLRKLGPARGRIPVFLGHRNPGFAAEIEAEVRDRRDGVVFAGDGTVFGAA